MNDAKDNRNISVNQIFAFGSIIYIIISEMLSNYFETPIFRYCDEIITLTSFSIIILNSLKRKVLVDKKDFTMLKLLMLVMLVGVISNILFKIQTMFTPIILDICSYMKVYLVYICFKIILTRESCKRILKILFFPAKICLILSTVCALISLILDIGMSGDVRFGIKSFHFIFGFAHSFAVITLINFLIIMYNNPKHKYFYMILTIICEILTTKGPSIIVAVLLFFLIKYFEKKEKISIKMYIFLGICCIIIGAYQINTYLINENAPRNLFFKYGFITAYNYFPLGSGFATYGSDMAAKNYSSLYTKYGFEKLHGMSMEDQSFLNDTYWPMIIGQFGMIGTIATIYILYIIYKEIMQYKNRNVKAVLFALFLYFIIHSIGSSILTSSIGVFAFIIFALVIKSGDIYDETI